MAERLGAGQGQSGAKRGHAGRSRPAAGFNAEADTINAGSLQRYDGFAGQKAGRTAQLADFFKAPVTTPNTQYTAAPLPASNSDMVNREIGTKRSK